MEWLSSSDDWASRWLFERVLAGSYLIAFLVAVNQFRPLLGERGLLPAPAFLAVTGWRDAPSLFRYRYSDRLLGVLGWTGMAVSVAALLLGVPQAGPLGISMLAWLSVWALYLSIVNVGQAFYGFGWESLLLEAGFLAAFLGNAETDPPLMVLWLLRWLLFRLEFGAGLIKLRGDPCWRDLTCLHHHHETQPMPNPLSRTFHHLPGPLHRVEVVANHAAQLVVPWLLFAPEPFATGASLVIVVTQSWLLLSGNFSWLNLVTIGLALAAVDGSLVSDVLPIERSGRMATTPTWHEVLVLALLSLVAWLSRRPVRNLLSRRQLMNASFDRLHLVNTYGAFGSVTRIRHEVVLEGTDDPLGGDGAPWKEYEFKGKPGDVRRRPRQIAPYHLRLDWLLWFAALSPDYAGGWFVPLARKLLENDGAVLGLLRYNPFPDEPPVFVRARLYRYRFTTRRERRETGAVWYRTLTGEYLAPIRLGQQATA